MEGGGTGTGGFYANAKKFKLTCENLTGKYSLVLLLKEGADQSEATKGVPTPTENNLQYIDQQNINTEKKATFDLFPKSLERGVYNVYVSTDRVKLEKVASFEYNEKPKYTLGDVNEDGEVNVNDVSLLLLYLVQKEQLSASQLSAADVNGDGEVNVNDVSTLLLHLVGRFDF